MPTKIEQFIEDYRVTELSATRPLKQREKEIVHDAIRAYLRTIGIETEGPIEIGDKVRWTSSGTQKRGTILAIVPSGLKPADMGFPKAGGGGMSRNHESYVVKGRRLNSKGEETGSTSLYWPHSSLIERDD